jgi:hypothetical protein
MPPQAAPVRSSDADPAIERKASPFAPEPCDERQGRSPGRGFDEIGQEVPVADRRGDIAALSENPHGAAADEAGVPGQVLGQPILTDRPAAVGKYLSSREDRVGLDAPPSQRAERALAFLLSDDQLGADNLRRAAVRPDDGGERVGPSRGRKLGHSLVGRDH